MEADELSPLLLAQWIEAWSPPLFLVDKWAFFYFSCDGRPSLFLQIFRVDCFFFLSFLYLVKFPFFFLIRPPPVSSPRDDLLPPIASTSHPISYFFPFPPQMVTSSSTPPDTSTLTDATGAPLLYTMDGVLPPSFGQLQLRSSLCFFSVSFDSGRGWTLFFL